MSRIVFEFASKMISPQVFSPRTPLFRLRFAPQWAGWWRALRRLGSKLGDGGHRGGFRGELRGGLGTCGLWLVVGVYGVGVTRWRWLAALATALSLTRRPRRARRRARRRALRRRQGS